MPNALRLYQGQPTTSETTLYTVPPRTGRPFPVIVNVKEIIATNTSGSAATFSLSVVPGGSTAGNANRIFAGQSIPANTEQAFEVDLELSSGDFLSGLQGTAGAITLLINAASIQ